MNLPDAGTEQHRFRSGPLGLPLWQRASLFGVLFLATSVFSITLSPPEGPYLSFMLPAGLNLACLLLTPSAHWKTYIASTLPASILFAAYEGMHLPIGFVMFIFAASQALIGASLIRRFTAERPTISTLREFGGLVAYGALVGPAIAGLAGATMLAIITGRSHLLEDWFAWLSANGMGVILLTPVLLSFANTKWIRIRSRSDILRLLEALAIGLLIAVAAYLTLIKGPGIESIQWSPLVILALWAGLRFGVRGASLALLWLAILTSSLTVRFHVGVPANELHSQLYVLKMMAFLASAVVFCLVPAVVVTERDRNLEALRLSERRLTDMSQVATEGIVMSRNGIIFDVNQQILDMFGYKREDVLGRPVLDFLTADSRTIVSPLVDRDSEVPYEANFCRSDGSVFPAAVHPKVSRIGSDVIRMAALRDLESSKKAERMLLHFADIVESSDDAIIGKNLDGIVTSWNPGAEAIFGYTESEAVGRSLRMILPHDRQDEEQQILEAITRGERIRHYETTRIRKDGTEVHISATISPIVDKHGQVIGASKIARDITDRKRTERDLQLFRAQVDGVSDGIVVVDPVTGCILDMNEGGLKSLGYTREEIVGMYLGVIRPDFDLEEFHQRIAMLADRPMLRGFANRRRKDGTQYPAEMTLQLVTLDRDYAVSVVRDVTEQRNKEAKRIELEALLRRSQKMETVGRFAAGIAHDFNNILGAIFGCAALLKEDTVGNAEAQMSTDEIVKAATRAKDLVQQILTFSNLQDPKRETVLLEPIVAEVLTYAQSTFPPGILMTCQSTGKNYAIADSSQVHRILLNLVQNGCQAMRGDSGLLTVELSTFRPDETFREVHQNLTEESYVCIAVTDTGHGIKPELVETIFEPFFTTKGVGKGTGLGLAIAYGIVQANRGLITVESQVGTGSTFRVFLPAAVALPSEKNDPLVHTVTTYGDREQVLVIDDDMGLLQATAKMLRRLNYRVIPFHDPLDAIAFLRLHASEVDLVVTDLAMPSMKGTDVADQIQKIRTNLPTILTSGFDQGLDKTNLRASGIVDFLQKPVSLEMLSEKVALALKQASITEVESV